MEDLKKKKEAATMEDFVAFIDGTFRQKSTFLRSWQREKIVLTREILFWEIQNGNFNN